MLKTVPLLRSLLLILIAAVAQSIQFLRLSLSSRAALSAEVLFLRKQLAFYQERQISPRRLTAAARFSLVLWSRFFHWRDALMIVKPETLIGWHRKESGYGGAGSRAWDDELSIGPGLLNPLLYVIGTDGQTYIHQFDGSESRVDGLSDLL
jgi:hypothetical protein